MRNAIRWAALLPGLIATASAAVIPVPGGNFSQESPQDGAAQVPSKWKLVEGKKGDCEGWALADRSGFRLKTGAAIETRVKVAALGSKEAAVKGSWRAIAHVDYWSVPDGEAGMLSLELLQDGQLLAGGSVRVERAQAPTGEKAEGRALRYWVVVPPDKFASSRGEEISLRLSCKGTHSVIVLGAGLCRVPQSPSRRLLGKPNGHLGPDLLGAGSLGFEAISVHKQQALQILSVRREGPAELAGLKQGDVILEVNHEPLPENSIAPGWDWFEHSHESVLGRAVESADARGGMVKLAVLDGETLKRVKLKVARTMNFSSLIPSDDKVAAALHQDTLKFLVRTQRADGSWSRDPIRTTFSALALLATRDATHGERIKRAVDYLLNRYPEAENFGNLGFWHAAYAGMLYSEYHLATGDERVLPRLEDIRDWVLTGTHTSKWGMPALGHGIGHLPYGQKALMAPLSHLIVYEALAQRGGMTSQIWEELWPFIEHSWSDPAKKDGRGKAGHGAMGYNASFKDLGEFWSRTGLCAMALHLREERPEMRDALTKIMRERHPWIRNSHAYGEPGGSWGLLGLNLAAPEAYREVIAGYSWWFALAWEPGYGLRFTQPHMGAPYMGTDDLINATYALVLAGPMKTLHLTGAQDRNWLDVTMLPTALSEVRVKRSKEGLVTLAGRIPGPEVRYTLDGTEPKANSGKYKKPFLLEKAVTLKACVVGRDGKLGPVKTLKFAPAKAAWQVVSASGHAKVGEALRRADRVIDGDFNKCWLTDNGEGSKGYPHHLVLDLSAPTEVKGLVLHFAEKGKTPGRWRVQGSLEADGKPELLAEGEWQDHATSREIDFAERTRVRFLRFEAVSGVTPEATTLMIRELEVR